MLAPLHCGCGRDNDPWRRFCGGCGSALGVACACGFCNKAEDRFCGGCGTTRRITKPAAAPRVGTIPIDITEILGESRE